MRTWPNQKYHTRGTVTAYLEKGIIVKSPCEECGNLLVDAHHPDYARPKLVRWLCRKHHREVHVLLTRIEREVRPDEKKSRKNRMSELQKHLHIRDKRLFPLSALRELVGPKRKGAQVTIRELPFNIKRAIKSMAINTDISMNELIIQALSEKFLKKKGA